MPCDIIIPVHPGTTDVLGKAARRSATSNPLIDASACRAYAAEAGGLLAKRLAKERGVALPAEAKGAAHAH